MRIESLKTTNSIRERPLTYFLIVVFVCGAPSILNWIGIDFGSQADRFLMAEIISWDMSERALVDEMYYALSGGLGHGLLEWTGVVITFLIILLTFSNSHFTTQNNITAPVIGVAFFGAGCMDAFHALAALRLIDSIADNTQFIPFTWVLSRGYAAVILIIGAIICLRTKTKSMNLSVIQIVMISFVFVMVVYWLVSYAADSFYFPQTQFEDALIPRPYDIVPMLLFIITAPIFWRLYKKTPNWLTLSLLLSLIPQIVLEVHMAFGSRSLFDNHFNIAHGLKIFAYLIPLIGLVFDYIHTYLLQEKTSHELGKERGRLQAIMDSTVDGIITIDSEGKIQSFNQASENIFGYAEQEVLGQNVKILMPEPYHGEHDGYLDNYLRSGKKKIIGIGREVAGKHKSGKVFPMDLSVSEVKLSSNKIFSGIVRDITERKQYEQRSELVKAIAVVANEVESVEDLLNNGLRTICQFLGWSLGHAYRWDKKHKNLQSTKCWYVDEDKVQITQEFRELSNNTVFESGEGLPGRVYESNVPVWIEDVTKDDRFTRSKLSNCENLRTAFSFPVRVGKETCLVLEFFKEHTTEKDENISAILDSISSQFGYVLERIESQDELAKILEDLKISNDELEKFAYIASHDLKSPLRAIDNLTQWLEEDLHGQLGGVNKTRMQQLRGRVTRMENLLDDLLEYSRAGRNLENVETVKADRLIKDIKNFLNIPASIAVIINDNLKQVMIPRIPLEQVFHNLIANAVKHHDKQHGKIIISYREVEGMHEFSIADDGPGISNKYHEKIFEMFQTLRPRDEVEGSGMGLALVKKIMHRFGGNIWLESEEGKGATFFFAWPKK